MNELRRVTLSIGAAQGPEGTFYVVQVRYLDPSGRPQSRKIEGPSLGDACDAAELGLATMLDVLRKPSRVHVGVSDDAVAKRLGRLILGEGGSSGHEVSIARVPENAIVAVDVLACDVRARALAAGSAAVEM
jgi:hypothetical protein